MLSPGAAAPTRITHVFDYLSRDYEIARQEKLQWKGADGVTVEGLLYLSDRLPGTASGIRSRCRRTAGRRRPTSSGSAARRTTCRCSRPKGYAVLQPNYRGSTGYGDAFLRDMVGHYFKNAHLDVMAGVDYADPRGHCRSGSHGEDGMERRRAHDQQDHHVHGSLQGRIGRRGRGELDFDVRAERHPHLPNAWFGGTPWQKDAPINVYWDNSPLKDVAKVKTPTIFLVGQNDVRVPSRSRWRCTAR